MSINVNASQCEWMQIWHECQCQSMWMLLNVNECKCQRKFEWER